MTCDTRVIDFDYALEQLYHDKKRNVHLEMSNRAPETEQRKERLRIEDKTRKLEYRKTRETAPVHSHLKRLKRGEVEEKPKTGEGGR